MPIPCVPPETLKLILEKKGYKVVRETSYNWTLALEEDGPGDVIEPIVIPRTTDLVSVEIVTGTMVAAHLLPGEYFDLKAQVENELKKKAN